MNKAVAVVLFVQNSFGSILTITRKDNPNSYGLVGGKIDPEDTSDRSALNREVLEETGVDISKIACICTLTLMDQGIPVKAFILPDDVYTAFPQSKTLTPEGTYMDFKNPRYLTDPQHSEFHQYNKELIDELKALLGI